MMALSPINLGSAPNDGRGDNLRTAGDKINANFSVVEAALAAMPGGASGDGFATVAAVLANATMTYGSGSNQVRAGQIVRAHKEGVRYEIAPSGASNHHVATAGGVKLYVLPTDDGHLPAVAFGWLANNSQGSAVNNYEAMHNALLAGSAQGRFVAIPAGVGFISRGFRYENDNYHGTGIIGLGARGACVIRFANTLSGGGSDRIWMINLHEPNKTYNFTCINVVLDGNFQGNRESSSCGLRMTLGNIAEHVFFDKVDTCDFGNGARRWLGGIKENACIDRDGRSWGNNSNSAHGFSTRSGVATPGYPVVFENCVAWDNGGYNFDLSSGNGVVRGTMHLRANRNAVSGSMKMSDSSLSLVADRIISEDAVGVGYRTTGNPPCDVDVRHMEFHRTAGVGFRTQAARHLRFGHLIFREGQDQDFLPVTEFIDIDILELHDGAWSNNDSAGSSGYQCFLAGPLRHVRIGTLIAHNNQSRIFCVRPSNHSGAACIVEIGAVTLTNNNRNNHGSNYLLEADARNHPVHLRIGSLHAHDSRSTPTQTRILTTNTDGGRFCRVEIGVAARGAGATGNSWISQGSGTSIVVGQSI